VSALKFLPWHRKLARVCGVWATLLTDRTLLALLLLALEREKRRMKTMLACLALVLGWGSEIEAVGRPAYAPIARRVAVRSRSTL